MPSQSMLYWSAKPVDSHAYLFVCPACVAKEAEASVGASVPQQPKKKPKKKPKPK